MVQLISEVIWFRIPFDFWALSLFVLFFLHLLRSLNKDKLHLLLSKNRVQIDSILT